MKSDHVLPLITEQFDKLRKDNSIEGTLKCIRFLGDIILGNSDSIDLMHIDLMNEWVQLTETGFLKFISHMSVVRQKMIAGEAVTDIQDWMVLFNSLPECVDIFSGYIKLQRQCVKLKAINEAKLAIILKNAMMLSSCLIDLNVRMGHFDSAEKAYSNSNIIEQWMKEAFSDLECNPLLADVIILKNELATRMDFRSKSSNIPVYNILIKRLDAIRNFTKLDTSNFVDAEDYNLGDELKDINRCLMQGEDEINIILYRAINIADMLLHKRIHSEERVEFLRLFLNFNKMFPKEGKFVTFQAMCFNQLWSDISASVGRRYQESESVIVANDVELKRSSVMLQDSNFCKRGFKQWFKIIEISNYHERSKALDDFYGVKEKLFSLPKTQFLKYVFPLLQETLIRVEKEKISDQTQKSIRLIGHVVLNKASAAYFELHEKFKLVQLTEIKFLNFTSFISSEVQKLLSGNATDVDSWAQIYDNLPECVDVFQNYIEAQKECMSWSTTRQPGLNANMRDLKYHLKVMRPLIFKNAMKIISCFADLFSWMGDRENVDKVYQMSHLVFAWMNKELPDNNEAPLLVALEYKRQLDFKVFNQLMYEKSDLQYHHESIKRLSAICELAKAGNANVANIDYDLTKEIRYVIKSLTDDEKDFKYIMPQAINIAYFLIHKKISMKENREFLSLFLKLLKFLPGEGRIVTLQSRCLNELWSRVRFYIGELYSAQMNSNTDIVPLHSAVMKLDSEKYDVVIWLKFIEDWFNAAEIQDLEKRQQTLWDFDEKYRGTLDQSLPLLDIKIYTHMIDRLYKLEKIGTQLALQQWIFLFENIFFDYFSLSKINFLARAKSIESVFSGFNVFAALFLKDIVAISEERMGTLDWSMLFKNLIFYKNFFAKVVDYRTELMAWALSKNLLSTSQEKEFKLNILLQADFFYEQKESIEKILRILSELECEEAFLFSKEREYIEHLFYISDAIQSDDLVLLKEMYSKNFQIESGLPFEYFLNTMSEHFMAHVTQDQRNQFYKEIKIWRDVYENVEYAYTIHARCIVQLLANIEHIFEKKYLNLNSDADQWVSLIINLNSEAQDKALKEIEGAQLKAKEQPKAKSAELPIKEIVAEQRRAAKKTRAEKVALEIAERTKLKKEARESKEEKTELLEEPKVISVVTKKSAKKKNKRPIIKPEISKLEPAPEPVAPAPYVPGPPSVTPYFFNAIALQPKSTSQPKPKPKSKSEKSPIAELNVKLENMSIHIDGDASFRVPQVQVIIPAHVLAILKYIVGKGRRAYLVGGAVRDLLRGAVPRDFDIVADCSEIELFDTFKEPVVKNLNIKDADVYKHGDCDIVLKPRGFSLYDDAYERDYDCNALYTNHNCELYDPLKVYNDVKARNPIKLIGSNFVKKLQEDPIRILRGIDLKSKMQSELDFEVECAITETADALTNIQFGALKYHLCKMFFNGRARSNFESFEALNLMPYMFKIFGSDFQGYWLANKQLKPFMLKQFESMDWNFVSNGYAGLNGEQLIALLIFPSVLKQIERYDVEFMHSIKNHMQFLDVNMQGAIPNYIIALWKQYTPVQESVMRMRA